MDILVPSCIAKTSASDHVAGPPRSPYHRGETEGMPARHHTVRRHGQGTTHTSRQTSLLPKQQGWNQVLGTSRPPSSDHEHRYRGTRTGPCTCGYYCHGQARYPSRRIYRRSCQSGQFDPRAGRVPSPRHVPVLRSHPNSQESTALDVSCNARRYTHDPSLHGRPLNS